MLSSRHTESTNRAGRDPRRAEARHLLALNAMNTDLVLRNAVAAAVMAPSSHNTQPWRFRIFGTTLDVLGDPSRQLHVIDREGRQLVQSCGCAVYNARVAIRAMGYDDELTVVLADNSLPDHLASIHLGGVRVPSEIDRKLMGAIGCRATNRRSFLARPIALADTDQLATAAEQEGATMVRLAPDQKASLAELIEEADRTQLDDPKFRDELTQWLAPYGSFRRDGIPFVEKEYGSAKPFALVRAMRSAQLGEVFGLLEHHLVCGSPVVIVLGTRDDDPTSWLACGQALQAILLHATARGFAAAFLNQVLEVPELRARVAKLVPEAGVPQMVLRIGVPAEPIERRAPRRSVADVLVS
jgi:nitroreductase